MLIIVVFLGQLIATSRGESNDVVIVTMRPNTPLTIHCPIKPESQGYRWYFNNRQIEFNLEDFWNRVHIFNDSKSLYIDAVKPNSTVTCGVCNNETSTSCQFTNFEFVVQNITDIRVPCENHGNVTLIMSAGGTHVYSCVCNYGFKGSYCENAFIGKFRLTFLFWGIIIAETIAMGFVIYRHMKQSAFRPPVDGYRFVDVLNDAYGSH